MNCIFCDCTASKCPRKDICILSSNEIPSIIFDICNSLSERKVLAVKERISQCNLLAAKWRYYKLCYHLFLHKFTQQIGTTMNGDSPAQSHRQFLHQVCDMNSLVLVDTIGGGDCFYDAIRLGCT